MKIVVLDGCRRVARSCADFDRQSDVDPGVVVDVLREYIFDQNALVTMLSGAEVMPVPAYRRSPLSDARTAARRCARRGRSRVAFHPGAGR